MKKLCLILALLLVLSVPGFAMAESDITVLINGEQVCFKPSPVIGSGTTLVPMRQFFEHLGAEVRWEVQTRTAVGVKAGVEVRIPVGSDFALVNGEEMKIGLPARLVDGYTLIPLRFVAEMFGACVSWNFAKREITIETSGEPPKEGKLLAPEVVFSQTGMASWYGAQFAGRPTASGEKFNPYDFTAAHRDLPFGTLVKVTFLKTGESILVRINDRGPHIAGRIIDLSMAAAEAIGLKAYGIGEVLMEVLR